MIDIFKNKSYWENFSENELNNYAQQIFEYYRKNGFPYYDTSKEYRDKEFNKLMKYNHTELIQDDVIKQTMHGLGLAWSYFPHSFDVSCNNKMTILDVFNDDDLFMKVIHKRLKMGTYISDSGIRKMLKMYSTTQGVSNFRPTAAAAIYDQYAPNGRVLDMSGGWGGRMLGAIKSSVKQYIACEPSSKTFDGLNELSHDYGDNTDIVLSKTGSENYGNYLTQNYFDLCFTSPPYFNLEKYADEDTQSYVKYPTIDEWINGFLYNTIKNCYYVLKKDKYMLINIADNKKSKISIEKATIELAEKVGFKYEKTLKLALSNPKMINNKPAFKYEPVFVFKK